MTDATADKLDLDAARPADAGAAALAERPYDSRYSTLLIVVLVEALGIAALILALAVLVLGYQPQVQLGALQANGRASGLVALRQPNQTEDAVLKWSARVVSETMTFGFNDWLSTLERVEPNFTADGYDGVRGAFERSGFIQDVVDRRQLVSAVPAGPAVIARQGLIGGVYTWTVQVPIVITFTSGNRAGDAIQMRLITLRIQQVPVTQNVAGLGIVQWTTETRSAN